MVQPSLFIGVVSHVGSQFLMSQGSRGLAAQLGALLPSVELKVSTLDFYNEDAFPITPQLKQKSLTAELKLDRTWKKYLGSHLGIRWWILHGLRQSKRAWHRIKPPEDASIKRLFNIELAHRNLMRAGLASGAPWILILEDDAATQDVEDLAAGLTGLLKTDADFINLSESFSTEKLGIEHLLKPSPFSWQGAVERSVLEAVRPVTNTVCAILYSAQFLEQLDKRLEGLPMTPIVPIDWKVNVALMQMSESGEVGRGSCLLVEPAPITQMSMHSTAILDS